MHTCGCVSISVHQCVSLNARASVYKCVSLDEFVSLYECDIAYKDATILKVCQMLSDLYYVL